MRGASSPSARTLFTSRSWVPASRSPLRPQPTAASLHRWTLLLSRALLPVGTTFVGRLLSTVPVGQGTSDEVVGVVPTIRGRAWVTQVKHTHHTAHRQDAGKRGHRVGRWKWKQGRARSARVASARRDYAEMHPHPGAMLGWSCRHVLHPSHPTARRFPRQQYATIVLDPTDPFPEGYTMGDIW